MIINKSPKDILNIQTIGEKEILAKQFEEIKRLLKESHKSDDLIRISILDFLIVYNPINHLWKYKSIKELSKNLISLYDKPNIQSSLLNVIEEIFIEPSPFKQLIFFQKQIPKEKCHLECIFKLILLIRNKELLLKNIEDIFKIKDKDFQFLKEKFSNMNFKNPFANILLREIIAKLIISEKIDGIEGVFQEEAANLKKYFLFRCPKCLEMLIVLHKNNSFFLSCLNGHNYSSNIKSIKFFDNLINNPIKCHICGQILELFETNFICSECNYCFCYKCSKNHQKNCLKFSFIEIYNVGFVCKTHYNKYITTCFLCDKDMCEKCKETHEHIIKEKKYYLIDKIIKKYKGKKIDIKNNDNAYLISNLLFLYDFFSCFNMYCSPIRRSIHYFEILKTENINQEDFYSKKFYDEEFVKYYSKLISDSKKGDFSSFSLLENFQSLYQSKKLISSEDNFYKLKSEYTLENMKVSKNIQRYLLYVGSIVDEINANNIALNIMYDNNKLKSEINALIATIKTYQIKIISLFNSNKYYTSHIKNINNRYFSDLLLQKIVKKYPQKLNPIELNLKNAYDIINNFKEDLLKNKNIKILNDIEKQFNLNLSNFQSFEEKKNEISLFCKKLKNKNKVLFKDSINTEEGTISKLELNFVLETLFYFKKIGNRSVHPNINIKESAKILNNENIKELLNKDNDFKTWNENKINKIHDIKSEFHNNSINKNEGISSINSNDFNINIGISNEKSNDVNGLIINANSNHKEELNNNNNKSFFSKKVLEKEITEEIKKKMNDIKNKIKDYFSEIIAGGEIPVLDILNFMFYDKFKTIFKQNTAFIRKFLKDIDSIINDKEEINYSIFETQNKYFEQIEDDLILLNKEQKSFRNLKINANKYRLTNFISYIENNFLENSEESKAGIISFTNCRSIFLNKISRLLEKEKIDENLSDEQVNALVFNLSIPHIQVIEKRNLKDYSENFKNLVKDYFIYNGVKNKLERIYKIIEDYFGNEEVNDNSNLIDCIKNSIDDNSVDSYLEEIKKLDINVEDVFNILNKILKNDSIKMISGEGKEHISLESILYYYQNK